MNRQKNSLWILLFQWIGFAGPLIFLLAGCQTEESYPKTVPIQSVRYLGWETAANYPILIDPDLTNKLTAIVNKLALVSLKPQDSYTVHVLNNSKISTCSTDSGNNIYISTAMIELTEKDEGELAALFAHEIGHAVLGHNVNKAYANIEHQRRARILEYSIILAGMAAGGVTYDLLNNAQRRSSGPAGNLHSSGLNNVEAVSAGLAISSGVLAFAVLAARPAESLSQRELSFLDHSYTLPQELAADSQALDYLSRAGYDGQYLGDVLSSIYEKQSLDSKTYALSLKDLNQRLYAIKSQLRSGSPGQ